MSLWLTRRCLTVFTDVRFLVTVTIKVWSHWNPPLQNVKLKTQSSSTWNICSIKLHQWLVFLIWGTFAHHTLTWVLFWAQSGISTTLHTLIRAHPLLQAAVNVFLLSESEAALVVVHVEYVCVCVRMSLSPGRRCWWNAAAIPPSTPRQPSS